MLLRRQQCGRCSQNYAADENMDSQEMITKPVSTHPSTMRVHTTRASPRVRGTRRNCTTWPAVRAEQSCCARKPLLLTSMSLPLTSRVPKPGPSSLKEKRTSPAAALRGSRLCSCRLAVLRELSTVCSIRTSVWTYYPRKVVTCRECDIRVWGTLATNYPSYVVLTINHRSSLRGYLSY